MKNILLLILFCLFGCGVFKKTSKTTATAVQSSTSQLESSQLVLKNADKETQVFTYWNDSGFYQIQDIKERVSQAKSGKMSLEESQRAKQEVKLKEAEPLHNWLYMGIIIAALMCYILYRINARND